MQDEFYSPIGFGPGADVDEQFQVSAILTRSKLYAEFYVRDRKSKEKEDLVLRTFSPEIGNRAHIVERLSTEVQSSLTIEHSNILTYRAFGIHPRLGPYFIYPEIEGVTLREEMDRGEGFLLVEIAYLLLEIAKAVEAVHAKGIVLGNLHPGTILLGREGQVWLPFVGTAALLQVPGGISACGIPEYPPTYASPEELSVAKLSEQTDIYRLGVLAYELLTGEQPFLSTNKAAIHKRIKKEDFPDPQTVNPKIPEHMSKFIVCATEKEVGDRFESIAEVIKVLENDSISPEPIKVSANLLRPYGISSPSAALSEESALRAKKASQARTKMKNRLGQEIERNVLMSIFYGVAWFSVLLTVGHAVLGFLMGLYFAYDVILSADLPVLASSWDIPYDEIQATLPRRFDAFVESYGVILLVAELLCFSLLTIYGILPGTGEYRVKKVRNKDKKGDLSDAELPLGVAIFCAWPFLFLALGGYLGALLAGGASALSLEVYRRTGSQQHTVASSLILGTLAVAIFFFVVSNLSG